MSWQTPLNRPPSQTAEVSIAEVCEQTGLSARTVRYYEELGLLPGIRRRASGHRVYGLDEVEQVGARAALAPFFKIGQWGDPPNCKYPI